MNPMSTSYNYTNNSGYPSQYQHPLDMSMYQNIQAQTPPSGQPQQQQQHRLPSPTLSDLSDILSPIPTVPAPSSFYLPSPPMSTNGLSLVSYHDASSSTSRYIQDYQDYEASLVAPISAPTYSSSRRTSSRKATHAAHPYLPSATTTTRRRPNSHLQMSSEDEDEYLADLPPNATDQQKLDYQRQRNTLAARRSRKRKELYKQELESLVDELTMETEKWKTRAEMLRRIVEGQNMGFICPDWSE